MEAWLGHLFQQRPAAPVEAHVAFADAVEAGTAQHCREHDAHGPQNRQLHSVRHASSKRLTVGVIPCGSRRRQWRRAWARGTDCLEEAVATLAALRADLSPFTPENPQINIV